MRAKRCGNIELKLRKRFQAPKTLELSILLVKLRTQIDHGNRRLSILANSVEIILIHELNLLAKE